MLTRQVQGAEVDLVANLAKIPVTINQLLNMRKGDVISADIPPLIAAEIDGVEVFECRYGTLNGQYAIKVENILAPVPEDTAPGEHHARTD
jgi:flagellar motor switch protein FliM